MLRLEHSCIAIKDLSIAIKNNGLHRTILQNVNLEVDTGECLGIRGCSGSGKSTLLKAILNLLPAKSGSVSLDGIDVKDIPPTRLYQQVQLIFQDPLAALHPRQTVYKCLLEPIRNFKSSNLMKTNFVSPPSSALVSALEQVKLSPDLLQRYPHQLSGGQRQRVLIARALVTKARILLLDEPTSALDVSVQATILNLLNDLRQQHGLTYILVSHDDNLLEYMCDRIATMVDGSLCL